MTIRLFKRCTIAILVMHSLHSFADDRAKHQMQAYQVKAIGLEIWVESDPKWDTHLEGKNGQSTFVAETPDQVSPVAGYMWSSSPIAELSAANFKEAALGAIHGSSRGYGVSPEKITVETLKDAHYGDLRGYEVTFGGMIQQTPVDVRVFVGHQPGKPLVVMQVCTQRGNIAQISEQIRRSWSHVKYLD